MRRRPDELEVVGGRFDVQVQWAALVADSSTAGRRNFFDLCVSLGRIEMVVRSIVNLASPNPESAFDPTSSSSKTCPTSEPASLQ
jgi:hypothetical protein